MTFPGPDASAPGQQPATPDNAQGASQATPSQATPQKSGAKKWLPIAGSVAVAGVLGAGSLTGWFGIGDPKVGDCVQMASETDFDVVDCAADEAEMKIVGIDEQEMTRSEFDEAHRGRVRRFRLHRVRALDRRHGHRARHHLLHRARLIARSTARRVPRRSAGGALDVLGSGCRRKILCRSVDPGDRRSTWM